MTDDMIKEHLVRAHLAESVTLDAGTWTEVLEEVQRLRELHELYKDKTERLRCTRCGLMTWPKDADEKVKEMLADALVTGTGMLRVTSEGVQRIDPATIYMQPLDELIADAEKVMRACQRGTRNYEEANNLHAQCYGTIGSLVNALRAKDDGAWIAEQKDLFGDDHGQR